MITTYARSVSERIDCTSIEVRRPYALKAVVAIAVALVGAILATPTLGGIGWMAFLAVLAFAAPVARAFSTERLERPELALEEGRLLVTDPRSRGAAPSAVDLADIRSGWELPANRSVLLRLAGRREMSIVPSDPSAVDRVLDHARVAPDQRALAMPLRRTLGAFTIGLLSWMTTFVLTLFGSIALAGGWGTLLAIMLATLTSMAVVARFGNPRIVVGTDGVRIKGTLFQRFVPFAELAQVLHYGSDALRIVRRDGTSFVIPLVALGRAHVDAVVRRIARAQEAAAKAGARGVDALARRERSIAEWSEDLARIAVAPAGFRDNALSREDFERVLADPNAPADQRLGAAIALRAADAEAARVRVRVAADATADDDLRRALLAAAEDEIDEAALERVTPARRRTG